jgi:sterol 14alpha-demethylase
VKNANELCLSSLFPGTPQNPPSYSIGYLGLVLQQVMVMSPSSSSLNVVRRCVSRWNPHKFVSDWFSQYGNVFTFILFGRRVTVALGPKGNNFILGGKSTALSAEDAYTVCLSLVLWQLHCFVEQYLQHLTTPVFGKDVVYDVPNELFMEQKKFVKVGLSTDNFRAYVGMFEDEVENFLDHDPTFVPYQQKSDEWNKFDVVKVMQEITILTASRTLQGKEVREAMDKSFSELYNDLDGGFTPINFLFPNLPLPSYRRRDRAQQKMSEFYINIIKKRRQGNEDVRATFHTLLLTFYLTNIYLVRLSRI